MTLVSFLISKAADKTRKIHEIQPILRNQTGLPNDKKSKAAKPQNAMVFSCTNCLRQIGLKSEHLSASKSSPLKSAKVKGEIANLSNPPPSHKPTQEPLMEAL